MKVPHEIFMQRLYYEAMIILQKTSIAMVAVLLSVCSIAMPAMAQSSGAQNINCPAFTSNLYRGLHDGDNDAQVTRLQSFLASQGYSQLVTGYYGALTYRNVIRFQRSHGISATGYFGPLTRGAIGRICVSPPQNGVSITSPVQGQVVQTGATLPISWSYPVTPGSASARIELFTAAGDSVGLIAVSNSTSGTYSWRLPPFPNNLFCTMQYPNGLCGMNLSGQYYIQVSEVSGNGLDANPSVYATARSGVFTITHATGQSTVSASPTSGAIPLNVTFNAGNYTGAYAIDFGDGTSASMQTGNTTHTYYNRGTYTAQFTSDISCFHTTPACMIAVQSLGSVVVTAY